MAKFFVGCMARIVKAYEHPELIGQECRIIGESVSNGYDEWVLSSVGSDWVLPKVYASDFLEPILYDGAQPSEFSYSELMDNLRTKVQEEV